MGVHIKGLIINIYGTLIDTHHAQASAWKETLDEEGVRSTFDEIRELIGMSYDELIPKLAGVDKNSIRGQDICKRMDWIFESKYLPHVKEFPKAKELLQKVRLQGIRISAMGMMKKEFTESLLRRIGVEGLVSFVTSSSDTLESSLLSAAMKRMGLQSQEVRLLGNTPYDLEAAYSADVKVIAFRCGGWNDEELKGALAIYQDPEDLVINFRSSFFGIQTHVA